MSEAVIFFVAHLLHILAHFGDTGPMQIVMMYVARFYHNYLLHMSHVGLLADSNEDSHMSS